MFSRTILFVALCALFCLSSYGQEEASSDPQFQSPDSLAVHAKKVLENFDREAFLELCMDQEDALPMIERAIAHYDSTGEEESKKGRVREKKMIQEDYSKLEERYVSKVKEKVIAPAEEKGFDIANASIDSLHKNISYRESFDVDQASVTLYLSQGGSCYKLYFGTLYKFAEEGVTWKIGGFQFDLVNCE